jgi:hypothetical protein
MKYMLEYFERNPFMLFAAIVVIVFSVAGFAGFCSHELKLDRINHCIQNGGKPAECKEAFN